MNHLFNGNKITAGEVILVSFLVLTLPAISCSQPGSQNNSDCSGHKRPEAVFNAATEAISNSDWDQVVNCFHPASRKEIFGNYLYGLSIISAFHDSLSGRLDPVLKSFGFKIDRNGRFQSFEHDLEQIQNWAVLLGELEPIAREWFGSRVFFKSVEIERVKVTGNTATGIAKDMMGKKTTFYFTKTDTGWFISGQE